VFPFDPARIYYDRDQLTYFDRVSGSTVPSDIWLAHEYGHAVQLALRLQVRHTELQADCLAGFYLGARVCAGTARQTDILATFQTFCFAGGPPGSTWFNPGVHGSCPERVSAVQRGLNGYLGGLSPGASCPL
jgi:predicted metalloprotease